MSELNINFELHSDIAMSDEETVSVHTEYINQNMYEEAKNVVDNNAEMSTKGIRASIFKKLEEKLQELQIYLLNKKATPYEYYSLTEPTMEFMKEGGFLYWIKPVE